MEPREGDLVEIAVTQAGTCYVLAVLERDGEGATRLSVDGDLDIHVPSGRLRMSADAGVDMVSDEVNVTARQLGSQHRGDA